MKIHMNPSTRMTTTVLAVALLLSSMLLSGCSTINDTLVGEKIDYKSGATKGASLDIPPDLSQLTRDNRYAVPGMAVTANTFQSDKASRAGQVGIAASNVGDVRIERSGSQRWLVVNRPADKLWEPVREFWKTSGFQLSIDQQDLGIIETDFAENRAKLPQDFIRSTVGKMFDSLYSTSERDKFRTRLERGAQPGTVEIYLSHRGMVEVYINEGKDATRWQPRQPDPELEAEMLRKLMMRLGADESRAKTQVAGAPQADRAKLNRAPTGIDVLNLDESFDRAWRRVGLALDRTGFTVEDRDRSQGLYFVRYMDPDNEMKPKESGGFLSKLMFWRDDDAKKVATPGDRFRIYVKDGASATSVQVLTREGGVDSSETGRKILGLLQEQLR